MIVLFAFTILYGKQHRNRYLDGQIKIQEFPNEFFDEKFNIYDESKWQKFIINYRLKSGKPLPKKDIFGNDLVYAIKVNGTSRDMREFFGYKRQSKVYLFPQVKKMVNLRSGRGEPIISYNQKYIWPYLGTTLLEGKK